MATAVFRAYRDYTTLQAEFMYNTLADTAVPGRDYTHVEGKAIIPVDSASVDIPVNIVDKNLTDCLVASICSSILPHKGR